MNPEPPVPIPLPGPPKSLRAARIIMWVQVVGTAASCVLVFLQAAEILSQGEELSGLGWFGIVEDPILLAAGIVAAIVVCTRRRWARPLAVFVEGAAILSGFINIDMGVVTGFVAIGLAITVLVQLFRQESGDWVNGERDTPLP